MTQFGGSLRFVQLPAVAQLLAELGSTGRLSVSHADWSGEIVVREGQIVEAHLGAEHGRAALEAIAVALPDGDFSFVDDPVDETSEVLVTADERSAYLDRLGAERQRLVRAIPSLRLVPRLVEVPRGGSADTQVTIGAAALQLIPSLVQGHTVEEVARQRGLARTVREVTVLMDGGLVELEPNSSVTGTDEPAPWKPVAVPVQPFSARLAARRFAPRQRPDAAQPVSIGPRPATVNTPPRASMPPAVAARLGAVRPVLAQPVASPPTLPAAPATPAPAMLAMPAAPATPAALAKRVMPARTTPPDFAAWRKAIRGFFLNDAPPAGDAVLRRAISV